MESLPEAFKAAHRGNSDSCLVEESEVSPANIGKASSLSLPVVPESSSLYKVWISKLKEHIRV